MDFAKKVLPHASELFAQVAANKAKDVREAADKIKSNQEKARGQLDGQLLAIASEIEHLLSVRPVASGFRYLINTVHPLSVNLELARLLRVELERLGYTVNEVRQDHNGETTMWIFWDSPSLAQKAQPKTQPKTQSIFKVASGVLAIGFIYLTWFLQK